MAAHRYWRLRGLHHNGGSFSGSTLTLIIDIEMRDTVGGPDLTTVGQAIGTEGFGTGGDGTTEDALRAFDDDPATFWQGVGAPDAATPPWIGQDFGAGNEKEIVEIALTHHASYLTRTWDMIFVEWSDNGVNWTLDWYILKEFPAAQTVARKPTGTDADPHRYWAVIVERTYGRNTQYASCSELEFFQEGKPVPTTGGTPLGKDQYAANAGGGYEIAFAFDGNIGTFHTPVGVGPSFLGYDWGAGNEKAGINGFGWRARNDTAHMQYPALSRIGYSDDGIGFVGTHYYEDDLRVGTGERRRYIYGLDSIDDCTFVSDLALQNATSPITSTVGWNATTGGVRVQSGYLWSTGTARSWWGQTVALDAGQIADVDAGKGVIRFYCDLQTYNGDNDRGRLWCECLDVNGRVIARRASTGFEEGFHGAFYPFGGWMNAPVGTRSVRISSMAYRASGTNNDSYWTNYSLKFYRRATSVHLLLSAPTEQSAVLEGWTNVTGTITARGNSGNWNDSMWFGDGTAIEGYRIVDIPGTEWDKVDANTYAARMDFTLSVFSTDNDQCRVWVDFLDGSGNALGTNDVTGPLAVYSPEFSLFRATLTQWPVGTRKLKVNYQSSRTNTNADGYLHRLSITAPGAVPDAGGGGGRRRHQAMMIG